MIKNPAELKKLSDEILDKKTKAAKNTILVSMGTCGIAAGTAPVLKAIQAAVKNNKLDDSIEIIETGCMGLCHSEPSIELIDNATGNTFIYGNVNESQAEEIIKNGFGKAPSLNLIDRTWYYPETEDNTNDFTQTKIVLKNSGRINPEKIEEYIAASGYRSLAKVLTEMKPVEVIDTIETSGLKGRGGGGFPTGRKWRFAADQDSDEKYVVCNADEGDPGAFMDRAVLEGDPHAVLEAMAITGYAIGAGEGVIYIRAEYPLAIKRLEIAIDQAQKKGLLGKNILGSGFDFDISLTFGAGAFVCGEETALIHSIEGERGMPTFKPPFPAVAGLWEKPTIVNNVETLANIPAIIRNGSNWFKKIGTENSPGTKVFALAGKINKVGLIEVPMGTSIREIVFTIGDGIKDGKKFKALQTGGPSGGCITEDYLDTPIDYDTLKALGSMMGSGGIIVMDEDNCMVDIAKFFLDFTCDESCGKCTPCRIGGRQMFLILDRITKGNGNIDDIGLLKSLSHAMKTASLCGLGQTASNPVMSTLKYFENEYLDHINDKKCAANKCSDLITYTIDKDKCIGCTLCARACPVKCITGKVKEVHSIDQSRCIRCGECYNVCKFDAVLRN